VLHGFNWYWIAIELTVSPVVALLVALPFWRAGSMIFGNIAGTAVLFGVGCGLIFREYAELDRLVNACLAEGTICFPDPSAFTRFFVYAAIAMVQVFLLFSLSLTVERRMRERDYAPEWRR
jgi:hypothetical protein